MPNTVAREVDVALGCFDIRFSDEMLFGTVDVFAPSDPGTPAALAYPPAEVAQPPRRVNGVRSVYVL